MFIKSQDIKDFILDTSQDFSIIVDLDPKLTIQKNERLKAIDSALLRMQNYLKTSEDVMIDEDSQKLMFWLLENE
jgi:hypothetical protein